VRIDEAWLLMLEEQTLEKSEVESGGGDEGGMVCSGGGGVSGLAPASASARTKDALSDNPVIQISLQNENKNQKNDDKVGREEGGRGCVAAWESYHLYHCSYPHPAKIPLLFLSTNKRPEAHSVC
jgi:hypothetical protein